MPICNFLTVRTCCNNRKGINHTDRDCLCNSVLVYTLHMHITMCWKRITRLISVWWRCGKIVADWIKVQWISALSSPWPKVGCVKTEIEDTHTHSWQTSPFPESLQLDTATSQQMFVDSMAWAISLAQSTQRPSAQLSSKWEAREAFVSVFMFNSAVPSQGLTPCLYIVLVKGKVEVVWI